MQAEHAEQECVEVRAGGSERECVRVRVCGVTVVRELWCGNVTLLHRTDQKILNRIHNFQRHTSASHSKNSKWCVPFN